MVVDIQAPFPSSDVRIVLGTMDGNLLHNGDYGTNVGVGQVIEKVLHKEGIIRQKEKVGRIQNNIHMAR